MIRLCQSAELQEGKSKGIENADHNLDVFVVRHQGKVSVYRNQCPHLGVALEFMPDQFLTLDKSLIICATHGALFEHETGLCVSGPCSGQLLQRIPHTEHEGWICIAS